MPAQSAAPGVVYVGELDTFPIPFIIQDDDKQPVDLSTALDVRIWIAFARWSPYYSPTAYIVENRPCEIVRPQTGNDLGRVIFRPLEPDLTPPDTYGYQFRVTWSDNTIQTIPQFFYPRLKILTPVAGQSGKTTGVP